MIKQIVISLEIMNKPLSILFLITLIISILLGINVSMNQKDGRSPKELTANRIIVYMVRDTLANSLDAHKSDGWYQYSTSFISSSIKISAVEGKENEFRKLINNEGIAEKTAHMTNNFKWNDEDASLILEKENGGIAVPVWLLAILQEKKVLNP